MKVQFDAVKRSASIAAVAACGLLAQSAFAVTTLPTPVTDMFTTVQDYVNLTFAAAIPVVALSVGLGIVITLAKRFSKKV